MIQVQKSHYSDLRRIQNDLFLTNFNFFRTVIMNRLYQLLLLFLKLTIVCSKDFYFYADVRWDQVELFKSNPESIPHNHGLRIVPAFFVAQEKLQVLNLWSASPKVKGYVTENYFYRSNSEFLASCKTVDGSAGDWADPCFVHANYDIGFCSPEELQPSDASVATLHCKNNPAHDHILSFVSNQTDPSSVNMPMLPAGSKIRIVFPDGTGLSEFDRGKFNDKFGHEELPERLSLKQLHERIKFIAGCVGDRFAGIIGSSDEAYNTALISRKLGVPNIVPSVTDNQGKMGETYHL